MAQEIERKFVPEALPADVVLEGASRLRQGYLALDGDVEVRVRFVDDDAVLTIKAGSGRSRVEVEVAIVPTEAEDLWPHTRGRRIEKQRERVRLAGLYADLDTYEGALEGLRTVEVEFPSAASADAFTPPAWFGREVTGDTRWSNAALALNGRPPIGTS